MITVLESMSEKPFVVVGAMFGNLLALEVAYLMGSIWPLYVFGLVGGLLGEAMGWYFRKNHMMDI